MAYGQNACSWEALNYPERYFLKIYYSLSRTTAPKIFCTHLITFFMLNPNMATKIWNSTIFGEKLENLDLSPAFVIRAKRVEKYPELTFSWQYLMKSVYKNIIKVWDWSSSSWDRISNFETKSMLKFELAT